MNQRFKEARNNVFQDDDPSSPYFGGVSSYYSERFIRLKPKADKVINAIRAYLKVE